jgi:drug/metabolite transporter (DMT)-like permease
MAGFVGFFGLFGSYFALQYLSLSDATVLAFLTPTVTAILGAVFLKEPYTAKEAISGLISFGGAILVAQPSFLFGSLAEEEDPEERLLAVGVALIGVVAASGAYVTIRKIGKKAHALHSVTYFCMVSLHMKLGLGCD